MAEGGPASLVSQLEAKVAHYEGKLASLTAVTGDLSQENERLREALEAAGAPRTDVRRWRSFSPLLSPLFFVMSVVHGGGGGPVAGD